MKQPSHNPAIQLSGQFSSEKTFFCGGLSFYYN